MNIILFNSLDKFSRHFPGREKLGIQVRYKFRKVAFSFLQTKCQTTVTESLTTPNSFGKLSQNWVYLKMSDNEANPEQKAVDSTDKEGEQVELDYDQQTKKGETCVKVICLGDSAVGKSKYENKQNKF